MENIKYEDFAKIDLRTATVVEAQLHPNADKLLVLRLNMGNGEERQIVAGIGEHYTPEEIRGMSVVIVANLEPRSLRGQISHGMLLAVHDDHTILDKKVALITSSQIVSAGLKVG